MNAEIICVGTELLLGDILNTNARYLSRRLAELGFNVFSQSVVGDNAARLERQINLSLSRSEILILSGGLGPTADDITKETVAKALGRSLKEDKESLRRIEEYFARTGRVMSENNKKQALTIEGAEILQNDYGTAPGYLVRTEKGAVVLLPGPPRELMPMFENGAVPILKSYSNRTLVSHNVRVFGIGESVAAELCGLMLQQSNPTVATYAAPGEVNIRVTAGAENQAEADRICAPTLSRLRDLFGENIYSTDCDNLQQATVELLRAKGMRLATAESCTAGLLSGRITEIPGSSEVFEMGVTAYANHIKIEALGVNRELIEQKGAVCGEVAAQMAVGIRTMCGADLGLGITGVAGPGESEGKPAGLVYIALADRETVYVRKILCRGSDRENTRTVATSTALDMARRYLQDCESLLSFGTPVGAPIRLMEGYSLPEAKPAAAVVTPKAPVVEKKVLSDEETFALMSTADEDLPENRPEKLEIEDDSLSFVFDDDYDIGSISSKAAQNGAAENNLQEETAVPKKKGFFAGLFPCKGDSGAEKARKIIFLVAFIVLIGTMGYLINYFAEGWLQTRMNNEAAKVWDSSNSMQKNADGIFIGFESLLAANSDVKAWLKIDGTNINNPVYQTTDNDYYINHNMNKQESRYGALFIDKEASIGRNSNNQNVVIYGHHMRDGTMFGPLKKYLQLDFYKQHSVIDFTTLYRAGQYKVFAVFITNTKPEDDNGYVFNYRISDFSSEESFLSWIEEVRKRSIINTGVDIRGDDEILTLSTCTYEFDDARLVVMARRIREDETGNIYATDDAALNPKPLYPQIWYTKKGIAKPNFSSTVSSGGADSSLPVSSENGQTDASSSSAVAGSSSAAGQTGTSTSSRQTGSTASTNTSSKTSSGGAADNTSTQVSSGVSASSAPPETSSTSTPADSSPSQESTAQPAGE